MTVERNYAIAIATLSNWFKNLARVVRVCFCDENTGLIIET